MADASAAQESVSFPTQDGGVVYGLLCGTGERGVVLAHGGRFNNESWEQQSRALVEAGFRALSVDFRGHGQSRGPSTAGAGNDGRRYDVLAAVDYLRATGAKSVLLVILEGSAHAQALFATSQSERVMREIITFLSAR